MTLAAIYIRMSSDRQEDSPERQLSQIKPYCQKKGYQIVGKPYQDDGMKGYDDSRPALARLIDDAKAGLFEIVVVDEQSRLSRSNPLEYFAKTAYPLQAAGVTLDIVSSGKTVDWSDVTSTITQTIDQHRAEQEITTMARRVTTALSRKAAEGKFKQGKPPYGMKRLDAGGLPILVPADNPETETVRWIYKAYVHQDWSLKRISRELQHRGIPSPRGNRDWGSSTLTNLLRNPAYAGHSIVNRTGQGQYFRMANHNGTPTVHETKGQKGTIRHCPTDPEQRFTRRNQHQPVIDQDTWDHAQQLLERNRKRTTPKINRGDFFFSKILRCEGCGTLMTGFTDPRGIRKYQCRFKGKGKCKQRRIRESTLLDRITDALREELNDEKLLKLRLEAAKGQDLNLLPTKEKTLAKKKAATDRAMDNLLEVDKTMIPKLQEKIKAMQADVHALATEIQTLRTESPTQDRESLILQMHLGTHKIREGIKLGPQGAALIKEGIRSTIIQILIPLPAPAQEWTAKAMLWNGKTLPLSELHLASSPG